MDKLAGKIAVITGGNSGLGLATAKRFRCRGRACLYHRPSSKRTRCRGETDRENVTGVQGDVSNLADL